MGRATRPSFQRRRESSVFELDSRLRGSDNHFVPYLEDTTIASTFSWPLREKDAQSGDQYPLRRPGHIRFQSR